MASILIGADIAPTKRNEQIFIKGNLDDLVGKSLSELLMSVDYRIFNLETPLTDSASPIEKEGINLIASTSTIKGIAATMPDLLVMANNHIMDQGAEGLYNTVKTIEAAGIDYIGIGDNSASLKKSKIIDFGNWKVGVYNCAEHEFSIASDDKPGANPYDPLVSFDELLELKKSVDYLIVLYHGGVELYQYPSPNLQRTCRKFVDVGANLVICQHSHCIGCEENYNNGTIVYGQGNFIFENSKNKLWDTSILVLIDMKGIEYIPVKHVDGRVFLAENEDKEMILSEFKKRSEQIKDPLFVDKHFREFVNVNSFKLYAGIRYSKNPFRTVLNRLTNNNYDRFLAKIAFRNDCLVRLRNYTECESQREVLLCNLREKSHQGGNKE